MVNLPGPIEAAYQKAQTKYNPDSPPPAPGVPEEVEDDREDDNESEAVAPESEPTLEPPVEESSEPGEDWEKRFKGYKASTDRTIHELRQMLAEREGDRATLLHEVEQLQRQVKDLVKSSPQGGIPAGVLDPEDVEILGVENARRIARVAQAAADKVRAEYEEKYGMLTRKQHQREKAEAEAQAKKATEDYWGRVKELVPDAADIDRNPKFSEFLNEVEPLSGKTWRDLGQAAKAAWDVGRMAEIYKAYKGTGEQKPDRSAEVVPRGTAHANAPARSATGEKLWTRKGYEKAVMDVMRGGPPTPEKSKRIDKLHADFMTALREGRVRG